MLYYRYIKQTILNLKFALMETFHYSSCFLFVFFQNEEFEFNIYNLVLYFFQTRTSKSRYMYELRNMGLKVSIEKSSMLHMLQILGYILELCWISVMWNSMIKAIIVISGVSMSDQFLDRYSLLFTNAQMSQWKKCRFFGL